MKKISVKLVSLMLIITMIATFIHLFFVKSEVYALSSSYTQYVRSGISAFPESYQKQLAYLKYLHPEWEFRAYYTGIEWSELTSSSAENACMKNTINKGNLLDPSALCICGREGDSGYYCASAKTVNFYLDPRNFMGEAMIFQFLDLSNSSGITRDMVVRAVSGTYLSNYVDDIMTAASEAGISPIHIVATIFQELGKTGTPRAISGTVPGYEGLYNFYNYGATDGDGAVERGLAKARELGWTNPSYALIDGAKLVLADNYISRGQITKYFYKFDVVGDEILYEADGSKTYSIDQFYNHQYMTNLRDPSSQAGTLYDIYAENGILDQKLVFIIPVYNNMPESVPAPTSLSATPLYGLFKVNSMKKWGVTFRASPGGASLGNIYKDTVVLHLGNEGSWSKVKVYAATTYNSSTKQWNYEEKIGYISSEYVGNLVEDIPDYRDQVDMGGGLQSFNNVEIVGDNLIMPPSANKSDVLHKYPNAIVKWADGTLVGGSDTILGTAGIVEIDGKEYICIKLGDTNSDCLMDAMDMYQIIQYLLGNLTLNDVAVQAADVNCDDLVDAMDMYQIIQHMLGNLEIKI